jgi:hypothetical protein
MEIPQHGHGRHSLRTYRPRIVPRNEPRWPDDRHWCRRRDAPVLECVSSEKGGTGGQGCFELGNDHSVVWRRLLRSGCGLCSWCFRLCGIQLSPCLVFLRSRAVAIIARQWLGVQYRFCSNAYQYLSSALSLLPFETFLFKARQKRRIGNDICQASKVLLLRFCRPPKLPCFHVFCPFMKSALGTSWSLSLEFNRYMERSPQGSYRQGIKHADSEL